MVQRGFGSVFQWLQDTERHLITVTEQTLFQGMKRFGRDLCGCRLEFLMTKRLALVVHWGEKAKALD